MSKVEQPFFDDYGVMAALDCQDAPEQQSPEKTWILAHYPDIKEDTEEWEQASLMYSDWCEFAMAIIDQVEFEASLNNIGDRYAHAMKELDELLLLQDVPQPNIMLRLAYAHCITVMEAFLMYAARALLNYPPLKERFHAKKSIFLKGKAQLNELENAYKLETECREPFMWRFREVQGQEELECTGVTYESQQYYKGKAQELVAKLTFHNLGRIKNYFTAMLTTPPSWPLEDTLQNLVDTRHDLVHRNGVTKDNQKIVIAFTDLVKAVDTIRHFITLAHDDLQTEISRYPDTAQGH